MNVRGILVVIHTKRIYMYYCCYSCIVKYKYKYIYLLVCPFLMDHHFSAQSSREAINVHVRYLFWFIYYRICFGLFTIHLIRLWMLLFLHEADQQLGYLGMFKSLCLLQGSEPPSVKERQLCPFANESFQNNLFAAKSCMIIQFINITHLVQLR